MVGVVRYVCLFLLVTYAQAFREIDFTSEVPAGKVECFFQPMKEKMNLEIEYQVVDGGDLDVDLLITSPSGRIVVSDLRRTDGIHTVNPTEEGDYQICFDNAFSRFSKKSVFFEIIVDNEAGDYDEDDGWKKLASPQEAAESKLAALELAGDSVDEIRVNNAKTLQYQALLRAFEAKDRNVAERNYRRINFWSVVNVIVMLGVFSIQVIMVRNMFSDNRKVRT